MNHLSLRKESESEAATRQCRKQKETHNQLQTSYRKQLQTFATEALSSVHIRQSLSVTFVLNLFHVQKALVV